MATCTAMYTMPAPRVSDASRAITDLRVAIAGPVGTVAESPVSRHHGGASVGRMEPIIGSGAARRPGIRVCRTPVLKAGSAECRWGRLGLVWGSGDGKGSWLPTRRQTGFRGERASGEG